LRFDSSNQFGTSSILIANENHCQYECCLTGTTRGFTAPCPFATRSAHLIRTFIILTLALDNEKIGTLAIDCRGNRRSAPQGDERC
jgi:hypothetical protein